jgi:ABC-type polysaccharide/polyol phosphate export permease
MSSGRHPLIELTLVRVREFAREPEAVFWAGVFPILLSLGLGVAFRSGPVESIAVAATSPAIADALRRDHSLAVELLSEADGRHALETGRIAVLVESASDGAVAFRYDDTNPAGRTARQLANQAIQAAAGRTDPIRAADDLVREPGTRYIDFFIPGLVGLEIMTDTLWGLGFPIVEARRRKLTKLLTATPMRRSHYLMSYLVWRMILLPVEVVVPIAFGALAFGVPVRGTLIDIGVITVLSAWSFAALGLLLAARPRTIEAIGGLVNIVQVPMWVLSGVFFSSQRFPGWLQPFIHVLPLTATVDALRANLLQGVGLAGLVPQLATLGVWTIVCFALALKLFRWR